MFFSNFFGYQNEGYIFKYYTAPHIIPIIIMMLLLALLYVNRLKLTKFKYEEYIRYTLGTLIIFTQMAYTYNNIYISELTNTQYATITKDLPLSLCGATMILSGFMLFTRSKKIFNIIYFWGIIGALLAIILPSAIANDTYGHYGPNKFRYYQFWVGHIGIIIILIYMILIHDFRIKKQAIYISYLGLILLSVIALYINHLVGSNYLFLNNPNDTGLGFFPNYPYSIIVFATIAFILYILAYLPWIQFNKK